jgi:hypothetical protein
LGRLWLKFRTNHWDIFSRKKSPNAIKNHPNGEILPNLVTLLKTQAKVEAMAMDKLQLEGRNLGRVFNSEYAMQLHT